MEKAKNPAFTGVSIRDHKNRGNIVHAAAARRLLPQGTDYPFNPWDDAQVERVREHSHLVVVLANAMLLGADESPMERAHDFLADNIERSDLPTLALGLGSQAAIGQSPRQKIPPGTLRLMRTLSERCHKIACRGSFTAEILNYHGIKNAEVTGCQSTFWHGAQLPTMNSGRRPPLKVAFNYSVAQTEALIVQWGAQSKFTLFGQTEHWEEEVVKGNTPEAGPRQTQLFNKSSLTDEFYRQYCKEFFRSFQDLDEWIRVMKSFDISFGTRFHGNMAAFIAGTPSLWFVHDQRTKELCEHLSLPHITLDEAIADMSIERFAELSDFGEFRKNYATNYNRFKSYIEGAGLQLRL